MTKFEKYQAAGHPAIVTKLDRDRWLETRTTEELNQCYFGLPGKRDVDVSLSDTQTREDAEFGFLSKEPSHRCCFGHGAKRDYRMSWVKP